MNMDFEIRVHLGLWKIRLNDQGSIGIILEVLVVANSTLWWPSKQGIFLLHACDSLEYCLSNISSSLLLGTWYDFISWLPCGWAEPYDPLGLIHWAGGDESCFGSENLSVWVRPSRVIFSFWRSHWQDLRWWLPYQPEAPSNYVEQEPSVNPSWTCGLSKK